MLPSFYIPSHKLFGLLPIEPFGLLVATAVVVGYFLGRRRARLTGLDPYLCADGMVWISVIGFVVAHLVSVIFYYPERILANPLVLFAFWSGISSFGGFIGGIVGAVVYFRRQGVSVLEYADAITFGLVPAWIIGRLGCTIVFDHKGQTTDFFLGMADRLGVVRHNLGFYEMLLAIALTITLYSLRRVRPFDGFHPAIMLLLYAPVRFVLDFLRIRYDGRADPVAGIVVQHGDRTYWGLTPAQYFAVAALVFSVALIVRGVRSRRSATRVEHVELVGRVEGGGAGSGEG